MAQDNIPRSKYGPIHGISTLVREGEIDFVRINRDIFKKDKAEKLKVQNLRNAHNRETRKMGYNPKKTLNPPGISL